MPTLTANAAMKARLVKAGGPPPTHQAAQHAADTSPKQPPPGASPSAQPKPVIVVPPPAVEDPEIVARRREQLERRNALWQRLRERAPALFAAHPSPPMAIDTHNVLVERLGLDAQGARDLKYVLKSHVHRPAYQEQLAAEGAVRLDLDGHSAGAVTEEERAWAAQEFERLRARLKA